MARLLLYVNCPVRESFNETRKHKIITVESFQIIEESRLIGAEVDMDRYNFDEVETDEGDQIFGG